MIAKLNITMSIPFCSTSCINKYSTKDTGMNNTHFKYMPIHKALCIGQVVKTGYPAKRTSPNPFSHGEPEQQQK